MADPPKFDSTTSFALEDYPHIHIHTLTEDDGDVAIAELVCHPCGEAIYIVVPDEVVEACGGSHPELIEMKETFTQRHEWCAEEPVVVDGKLLEKFDFHEFCPTHRTVTKTVTVDK